MEWPSVGDSVRRIIIHVTAHCSALAHLSNSLSSEDVSNQHVTKMAISTPLLSSRNCGQRMKVPNVCLITTDTQHIHHTDIHTHSYASYHAHGLPTHKHTLLFHLKHFERVRRRQTEGRTFLNDQKKGLECSDAYLMKPNQDCKVSFYTHYISILRPCHIQQAILLSVAYQMFLT